MWFMTEQIWCYVDYHGDHAVILLPGTAAAKKGNEEYNHTHNNDNNWGCWGCRILNHKCVVKSHLHHDSQDNQSETTYLQKETEKEVGVSLRYNSGLQ